MKFERKKTYTVYIASQLQPLVDLDYNLKKYVSKWILQVFMARLTVFLSSSLTSSNVLLCPQTQYIQFVIEDQRK